MDKPFSVIAGKYEGNELNCKYSDDFETLDEAIDAYDKVSDYPWSYITYMGRTLTVMHPTFKIFE